MPPARALPNSNLNCPLFLIGDGGFPLDPFLMKPFLYNDNLTVEQHAFNYRLSSARWIVENAFGLLTQKWHVNEEALGFSLETTEFIVMSTICLQNYLITSELNIREENRRYVLDRNRPIVREAINPEDELDIHNLEAYRIRERLSQYFVSPAGSVPWQWNRL